jgi:hypothetical protein
VAEVSGTLAACCRSTSSSSTKASIAWPSTIFGGTWVDGSGATSSLGHERRWLSLLDSIVRVVFQD